MRDIDRVVSRLAELSRMLDQATDEIARLDEAAVRATAKHEVEFARHYLTAEGSQEARKQQALLLVADVKLDAEIARQRVRACQERIRTLRSQIEVGRSLNAAQRSEWAASGVGT